MQMYRQSYSEQPSLPNISYDYRSSSLHYKQPNMQGMTPGMHQPHQSHQLYYENSTTAQQMPQQMSQQMGQSMGQMGQPMGSMNQQPMQPYMNMMPMDPVYDINRYYWREMEPKQPESYSMSASVPVQYAATAPPPPPLNIVQRISGLIKSQLPHLQSIMQISANSNYSSYLPSSLPSSNIQRTDSHHRHRSRSDSRSRSKQRDRQRDRGDRGDRGERDRDRDRDRQRNRKGSDPSHDWLCRKCSFSNYNWRDNCMKCKETRLTRNFVPGPQDWKCPKCENINYARRMECNRCKRPKPD